jgi:tetratricopeptide (TPR) repeat protein
MQTHVIDAWWPRKHRFLRTFIFCVLVATTTFAVTATAAAAAQRGAKHSDKREIDARQAFAAGRYQEALNLYAELYADRVHPTFLRNIGRCYQNLQQPEKAINAFRDYLRQAKNVSQAEKQEIDNYIAEMEKLKQQQEDEARSARTTVVAQPLPPPPPPADVQPAGANLRASQPAPAAPVSTPLYKNGWFWGGVGVAIAAGVVGGLYAGGVFGKSSRACTVPGGCY